MSVLLTKTFDTGLVMFLYVPAQALVSDRHMTSYYWNRFFALLDFTDLIARLTTVRSVPPCRPHLPLITLPVKGQYLYDVRQSVSTSSESNITNAHSAHIAKQRHIYHILPDYAEVDGGNEHDHTRKLGRTGHAHDVVRSARLGRVVRASRVRAGEKHCPDSHVRSDP